MWFPWQNMGGKEEEEEEAVVIRDSVTNEDPPKAHQEEGLSSLVKIGGSAHHGTRATSDNIKLIDPLQTQTTVG